MATVGGCIGGIMTVEWIEGAEIMLSKEEMHLLGWNQAVGLLPKCA